MNFKCLKPDIHTSTYYVLYSRALKTQFGWKGRVNPSQMEIFLKEFLESCSGYDQIRFLSWTPIIFEALLKDAKMSGPLSGAQCQHVEKATRLTFVTQGTQLTMTLILHFCPKTLLCLYTQSTQIFSLCFENHFFVFIGLISFWCVQEFVWK